MKRSSQLNDQRGFGLAQTMVAVALVGVIAAGATSLFQQLMVMQQRSNTALEEWTLTNELQTILSTQATCRSALGIGGAGLSVDLARATQNDIWADSGSPITVFTSSADRTIRAGFQDRGSQLRVDSLNLFNLSSTGTTDPSGRPLYMGSVRLASSVLNGKGDASAKKPRVVANLFLALQGNQVVECYTSNPNDRPNMAETCAGLGGTYTNGSCQIPSSRDAMGNLSCPSGYMITGYSNNAPICTLVPQSTTTVIYSTTVVQSSYDPCSDPRLLVGCNCGLCTGGP